MTAGSFVPTWVGIAVEMTAGGAPHPSWRLSAMGMALPERFFLVVGIAMCVCAVLKRAKK